MTYTTDIVVIGGPRWDPDINATALHTVRALAEIHRVLYVYTETQGSVLRNLVRPLESQTLSQAWCSLTTSSAPTQLGTNLWLLPLRGSVRLLPMAYPPLVRELGYRHVKALLRQTMTNLSFANPILWFYWWFYPELTSLPNAATVYDIIDDHAAYEHNARWPRVRQIGRRLEAQLLGAVDHAYCLSPALAAALSTPQTPVRFLPPAVDLTTAEAALSADAGRRAEVDVIPRPRIGYVGQLGARLDWKLIEALSALEPEWQFVFIGGDPPRFAPRRPNIHYFGRRSYPEIIRSAARFDVGIVPFVDSPSTRGAYSYKAFDYLVSGIPVVATSLPFSVDLARQHPGSIRLAENPAAWRSVLADMLVDPRPSSFHKAAAAAHALHTRTDFVLRDIEAMARERGIADEKG